MRSPITPAIHAKLEAVGIRWSIWEAAYWGPPSDANRDKRFDGIQFDCRNQYLGLARISTLQFELAGGDEPPITFDCVDDLIDAVIAQAVVERLNT